MKKLFYIKMSTNVEYLGSSHPLLMEMYIHEYDAELGSSSLNIKNGLVARFPDYFIQSVRLATKAECNAYDNGYDLGYNLGYNDAKEDNDLCSNEAHPQVAFEPDVSVRLRERILSELETVQLDRTVYSEEFQLGFEAAMMIAVNIANIKVPN